MSIRCEFRLSDESQTRIAALSADVCELRDALAAQPSSETELLQPLLELFFGILADLGTCFILVEGDATFDATGTREPSQGCASCKKHLN